MTMKAMTMKARAFLALGGVSVVACLLVAIFVGRAELAESRAQFSAYKAEVETERAQAAVALTSATEKVLEVERQAARDIADITKRSAEENEHHEQRVQDLIDRYRAIEYSVRAEADHDPNAVPCTPTAPSGGHAPGGPILLGSDREELIREAGRAETYARRLILAQDTIRIYQQITGSSND